MRVSCLLLVLALPLAAEAGESGVDAIARVARGRGGETMTLTFQADACTLTAASSGIELHVPVRTVSWSMTKETDGSGDAVVTARCAGSKACVTGGKVPVQRFAFRLATGAREARAMLRDLKALATHCSAAK